VTDNSQMTTCYYDAPHAMINSGVLNTLT